MIAAHFEHLPACLCRNLEQAQHRVCIAVCWFSHRDIFQVLLGRLRAGVQVELLIEYDTQNIRDQGLDFHKFIAVGGQLYASREPGLMHHKFVIIDDHLLLTGSFNWTYNSNAENLLIIADTTIIEAFQQEFNRQKYIGKRILQVDRADLKVFSTFPLFKNTCFRLTDLRKRVSSGAGVWLIRVEKLPVESNYIFKKNLLPFDADHLLAPYWAACRVWDQTLFDQEVKLLKVEIEENSLRDLYRWTRRMRTGDLVLATEKKQRLLALGMVQSDPMPYGEGEFSSCREVQWLKIQLKAPYLLQDKVSGQPMAKFRGSAMRLLQEIFGE
ncbi:MAG: phospholipase D-like domain-containing protein [Saprospiraceae bacterium]